MKKNRPLKPLKFRLLDSAIFHIEEAHSAISSLSEELDKDWKPFADSADSLIVHALADLDYIDKEHKKNDN